jgi:hypothetical protein
MRGYQKIEIEIRMSELPIAVPAQAGTHCSAIPNFSSNGNAVPIVIGSCRGGMDAGLRRGGNTKSMKRFHTF